MDIGPVAVLHSQALLAGGSRQVGAVAGDVRDSLAVLSDGQIRAAGFDPGLPRASSWHAAA